jgi:hypothetical protein
MSSSPTIGFSIWRPFAFDEIEPDSHRLERQEQVGEEDSLRRPRSAARLHRDLGREIGRPTQIQQGIALAQVAVLDM